jgi:DNA-directed RNA polymerase subunit RPC12/RpoP
MPADTQCPKCGQSKVYAQYRCSNCGKKYVFPSEGATPDGVPSNKPCPGCSTQMSPVSAWCEAYPCDWKQDFVKLA